MKNLKKFLVGRPLKSTALKEEKYGVFRGLPVLASDPISSVAYASEEILIVLVPAIGLASFHYLTVISAAIIGLLILLVLSYRQTIESYPTGGGAFAVAKDNLGVYAGVAAGSALSVDYILTVAVSISAGTAAIVSAFPTLFPYRVVISILFLLVLMIGNLRGVKESARIFSIPTYAFVVGIVFMIIYGIARIKLFGYAPAPISPEQIKLQYDVLTWQPITIMLLLKAFSSGMAAVTGVEAVSNAVPNFRDPATKHARHTLAWLGVISLVCFGGVSLLANMYQVIPDPTHTTTVLSQIANAIFGSSFMYYYIQVTTMFVLTLAANTAYTGFPMLISVMAREGYAPRQLNMRGDRLSYSNGILLLSLMAALLIIIFEGETHLLIPLYAIGVFMSFTLSQSGMFIRWLKKKEKVEGRFYKALINGTGALVTGIATIIIGITKFSHGAWIVVVVIPILIAASLAVKRHYSAIACQLKVTDEELEKIDISASKYKNHVIVPIESLNKASIRAIRYACTISESVVAFNVSISEEDAEKLKRRWSLLKTDIKLVVKYSPFRKIIEPLLKFVESEEHEYQPGDIITVILPQFSVTAWWQIFLHNETRIFIANKLLKHKHIVIATMPLQLKEDKVAIERYLKKKCD